MTTANAFGEVAKKLRLALGVSLRQFCRDNNLDWGYISRVERGVLQPPKSREAQENYARALKIKDDSEDWQTFMDLAAISGGNIPERIMSDKELVAKLPMVFRTIQGQRLSPAKLRELAKTIRKT